MRSRRTRTAVSSAHMWLLAGVTRLQTLFSAQAVRRMLAAVKHAAPQLEAIASIFIVLVISVALRFAQDTHYVQHRLPHEFRSHRDTMHTPALSPVVHHGGESMKHGTNYTHTSQEELADEADADDDGDLFIIPLEENELDRQMQHSNDEAYRRAVDQDILQSKSHRHSKPQQRPRHDKAMTSEKKNRVLKHRHNSTRQSLTHKNEEQRTSTKKRVTSRMQHHLSNETLTPLRQHHHHHHHHHQQQHKHKANRERRSKHQQHLKTRQTTTCVVRSSTTAHNVAASQAVREVIDETGARSLMHCPCHVDQLRWLAPLVEELQAADKKFSFFCVDHREESLRRARNAFTAAAPTAPMSRVAFINTRFWDPEADIPQADLLLSYGGLERIASGRVLSLLKIVREQTLAADALVAHFPHVTRKDSGYRDWVDCLRRHHLRAANLHHMMRPPFLFPSPRKSFHPFDDELPNRQLLWYKVDNMRNRWE